MIQTGQLPDSRLYTFLDEPREFALYFLEGQRLIQDLALLHSIQRDGFAYFRDVVLSIEPMIALLKHDEQFGFYIDSETPYFRLKIEAAQHGDVRCMLLPEELREFPQSVSGLVRMLKLFPNNRPAYESVLQADALPLRAIVNHVLTDSYQVNSTVLVSDTSDQSLMLHQFPPLPRKEEYEYSPQALHARREQVESEVRSIFQRGLCRPEEIEPAFREIGFKPLAHRTVQFKCNCSRERMLQNLQATAGGNYGQFFDLGQEELEVICEYCKAQYRITRTELERADNPQN